MYQIFFHLLFLFLYPPQLHVTHIVNQIFLLYLYHGSLYDYNEEWTINLENFVKYLNEKGIREAANIYAYESNPEEWNVVNDYEHDYFCVTVGELVNKGIIKNIKYNGKDFHVLDYIIMKIKTE